VDWPNFFLGILYSFLPRAYWGGWRPSSTVDFARSALVSGLVECVGSLYFLIDGYLHFLVVRTQQMSAVSDANEGTQFYLLAVLTFEYALHPLSLIGLCLAGEGAFRAWIAFFTDEATPSFLLRVAALVQHRRETKRREAALGPEIPDLFERIGDEGSELRISAQRPKEGWRRSMAVAVEDEFYEIVAVETAAGVRSCVYILRKMPPGRVIRGMYRYDPPQPPPQE
jgi:hypothetical protein